MNLKETMHQEKSISLVSAKIPGSPAEHWGGLLGALQGLLPAERTPHPPPSGRGSCRSLPTALEK